MHGISRAAARLATRLATRLTARLTALAAAGLTVLSAQAAPHQAPDAAALRAAVDAAIRPLMAKNDIPGMAVGVTVGGKSFVFNYGVASRQSGQPVDDRTLFEVGSVSKTFNATFGAQVMVDGKLQLSDHPSRHLPALKGHPIDRATLLNLVTYTAGGLTLQVPDAVTDEASLMRYLQQWKPDFAPGAKRRYSNPSIGLFGRAAAAAIGRDYADAVESDLLPKLGLRETYLRVPTTAMTRYATGYDKVDHQGTAQDMAVRVSPGAFDSESYGIKTTAADLVRFMQVNIDPSGLDATTRQAVEATHIGHFQVDGMTQGLGWEQYPWPVPLAQLQAGNALGRVTTAVKPLDHTPAGPRLFNKTGSTRGFGAYVVFVPTQRIGVVLLGNRSWPIPERVDAAYAILGKLQAGSAR
ncbi:class C beta-lactamase [Roseateles chitinivorans]|uniref:class C beta-lactamase n=1 Tax=Roseateles chitinivorans TaxID=2917965 RepID=UPI003D66BFE9